MMEIKSILKPEGSVVSGIATVGAVFAIYNMDCGNVSMIAASDANHPTLETCRKKAGYTAFALVSVITLLTKDANVGILGYASIIAAEAHYRQAIMADPVTGAMQPPAETAYDSAQNVTPLYLQAQPA